MAPKNCYFSCENVSRNSNHKKIGILSRKAGFLDDFSVDFPMKKCRETRENGKSTKKGDIEFIW